MRILINVVTIWKKWLMEWGYNEKMIRKQILRAQEHSRNLFEREKPQLSE